MSARQAHLSDAVTVLVTSTLVASRNVGRRRLILCNDSANVVYLALETNQGTDPTATSNSGIRLNASGGSVTLDDYSGAVSGIASGSSVVTRAEY